ncbi:stage II sporulation protein R [Cohnella suwonensis]|uniref:Stage II sporulation protein R n=1 Tax=Cohnella suwonensis TaxID=696072 RepID=A0ABW0LXK3_9BACL
MRISHHSSLSSSRSKTRFARAAGKFVLFGIALLIGLLVFLRPSASAGTGALIPDDAIRIRIIANSDGETDQRIKAGVRDAVASSIRSWGAMPDTHDEARALIAKKLPALRKVVAAKLKQLDAPYGGKVELAKVPFPAKTFEGKSYAAGNYEALRVTLGDGKGANWWCVLFPPLCLTAATANDDAASGEIVKTSGAKETAPDPAGEKPETKFFLWELLEKLIAFLSSLF